MNELTCIWKQLILENLTYRKCEITNVEVQIFEKHPCLPTKRMGVNADIWEVPSMFGDNENGVNTDIWEEPSMSEDNENGVNTDIWKVPMSGDNENGGNYYLMNCDDSQLNWFFSLDPRSFQFPFISNRIFILYVKLYINYCNLQNKTFDQSFSLWQILVVRRTQRNGLQI